MGLEEGGSPSFATSKRKACNSAATHIPPPNQAPIVRGHRHIRDQP